MLSIGKNLSCGSPEKAPHKSKITITVTNCVGEKISLKRIALGVCNWNLSRLSDWRYINYCNKKEDQLKGSKTK